MAEVSSGTCRSETRKNEPLELSARTAGDIGDEDLLVAVGDETLKRPRDLLGELTSRDEDERPRLLPVWVRELERLCKSCRSRRGQRQPEEELRAGTGRMRKQGLRTLLTLRTFWTTGMQ